MRYLISSIGESFKLILKDKIVLLFSLVPITIGSGALIYFGKKVLSWASDKADVQLKAFFTNEVVLTILGKVIYFIFFIAYAAAFYYTIFLVISIIASPFNEAISSRIEKIAGGKEPEKFKTTMKNLFKNFFSMVFNELKKISFIVVLQIVSLLMGATTILLPISIVLSSLLMAVQFIDYSWSRHNIPFRSCLKESTGNIFSYGIAGGAFLALVAVPVVNILSLPFGAVYFTILRVRILAHKSVNNSPGMTQV